ncbi:HipA domain-containing protein [Arthrobacter crystallopoietes BAB-32]|uniref:HipA domain-containing protein n=1 Tax=Arthrobacter crystallopoietes BAB-32 TaxID=1246476 RepID=N1V0F8_9MICC|nr:HipA domain-containing protein [Arthrobacter crystallopoietes]EMY34775.1 HipA domain-containing protein [Arthrobacter crystallopoietes BAB-32]
MSPDLDVFLRGRHVGVLSDSTGHLSFQYTPAIMERYGTSSVVLSLSLPVSNDAIVGPRVSSYFDGLLPLENDRYGLAEQHGLQISDTLGFLSILGPDLPGALQIFPSKAAMEPARWDQGFVPKPIFKQPKAAELMIPDLLISEEWALRVARSAGLPAVDACLTVDGASEHLAVTRYDYTPDGEWLHQEDFNQALALPREPMYEDKTSTPSRLTQLTALAKPHMRDPAEFMRTLLRAVTFNLLIGNGDAHSKNYTLLIRDGGEVRLAPMYDVAPTRLLCDATEHAGHALGGERKLSKLTLEHLVQEGTSWGLEQEDARAAAVEVLESAGKAAAREPADDRIDFLSELVPARSEDLLKGGTARDRGPERTSPFHAAYRKLFPSNHNPLHGGPGRRGGKPC